MDRGKPGLPRFMTSEDVTADDRAHRFVEPQFDSVLGVTVPIQTVAGIRYRRGIR
jgi:hypothetical protein